MIVFCFPQSWYTAAFIQSRCQCPNFPQRKQDSWVYHSCSSLFLAVEGTAPVLICFCGGSSDVDFRCSLSSTSRLCVPCVLLQQSVSAAQTCWSFDFLWDRFETTWIYGSYNWIVSLPTYMLLRRRWLWNKRRPIKKRTSLCSNKGISWIWRI